MKILSTLLILIWMVFTPFLVADELSLTVQERQWLEKHPRLKVGTLAFDFPPYIMISGEEVKGIFPDFLAQVANTADFELEYVFFNSVNELEQALFNHKIDLISGLNKTKKREQFVLFTEPYIYVPRAILSKGQSHILSGSIKDFEGQLIASEKGFASREELRDLTTPRFFDVDNTYEAITAVKYDLAQIYYGDQITISHFIEQFPDAGLMSTELVDVAKDASRFAISTERPELVNILNKAIANISEATRAYIVSRWNSSNLNQVRGSLPIQLTETEKAWLEKHKTVRFAALHQWHPIAFTDKEGKQKGLSIDALKLITERLGVRFEFVETQDWQESIAFLEQGKIDVLPAVVKNPMKSKLMDFTNHYHASPWVVVSARDNELTIADLQKPGLRIANPKGGYARALLSEFFPEAEIIEVDDLAQSFKKLNTHQADVVFSILSTAAPWLQGEHIGKYKVINDLSAKRNISVHMGVNKHNSTLKSLLNKALADISNEELESLSQKWLRVQIKQGVDVYDVFLYSFAGLIIVLCVLSVFVYWNTKLQAEIKQRSVAEQRAKNAEFELNSLADAIPGAVIQFNVDDDLNMQFSYVSKGIERITTLTPQLILKDANHFIRIIHQEDKSHFMSAKTETQNGMSSVDIEFRIINGEGKVDWLQLVAYATVHKHQRIWNGVLLNINERKEQEFLLANAKQAAEQATNSKSRFLAMMSHEIRTPVSGMIGMLELLSDSALNTEQQRDVKTISDSAHNLMHILNDVLDHSKMEQGQLTVEKLPCNLLTLTESVVQMHSHNAHQKNLDVVFEFDHDIKPNIVTDPVRLQQILSNFISNAVKFTEKGYVSLKVAKVTSASGSQTLAFTVKDTGIGISQLNQRKLFKPFAQAEDSTSRKYGGTGLGLTICKMLVERLGGEIKLTSQLNRGTEFYFELTFEQSEQTISHQLICDKPVVVIDDGSFEIKQIIAFFNCHHYSHTVLSVVNNQSHLKSLLPTGDCVFICHEALIKQYQLTHINDKSTWIELSKRSFSPQYGNLFLSASPMLPTNLVNVVNQAQAPEQIESVDFVAISDEEKALYRKIAIEQGRLILVAEDHPTNQLVIKRQIEKLGFVADFVDDGMQALAAMNEQTYGLLLTDCHMPNLDGYELTKKLRAQGSTIAIIALTANALSGEAERCVEIGMNDYMSKPVSMALLKEKLDAWLDPVTPQENVAESIYVIDEEFDALSPLDIFSDDELRDDQQGIESIKVLDDTHGSYSEFFNIANLMEMFGDELLIEQLVSEFMSSSYVDLDEMKNQLKRNDMREVALVAHRLKGAASMVELKAVVEVCASLETQAKSASLEQVSAHIKQLESLFNGISHAIKEKNSAQSA